MSDFPSAPAFSSPTPDVATGVPRLEAWLKTSKQGIGRGLQSLTIASGSITPADGTTGSVKVDTESAASTDDLTNIAQTNIPDGHYVMLQITDNARKVVVKHNAGGTGDIELSGSLDFEMNRTEQRLLLQRSGTTWVEVFRSGREKDHTVGGSGEPAYSANWQAGTYSLSFRKDETGRVWVEGTVERTGSGLTTASIATVFTLPAGYRPAFGLWFPIRVETSSVNNLSVSIDTAGIVQLANESGGTIAVGTDWLFTGVSFPAAA